jgi:hypothetical protein
MVRDVIRVIDACLDDIASSAPQASDGNIVRREIIAASRLARHGAYRQLRLVNSGDGHAASHAELAADLEQAMALHRAAWLERSRPGGMEIGLDALEATVAAYQR